MEPNHKLALYPTYYLARFNNIGLANLGYSTWNDAFEDISKKLGVKRHSVKNWRDEFDPLFGHRAGWHQRPMIKSRVTIVQALEELDEPTIRGIVIDILSGNILTQKEDVVQLLNIIDIGDKNIGSKFIVRTPTGRAAEDYFIKYYSDNHLPYIGNLIDTRDLGVGYDFRIESEHDEYYIEVKGLSELSGGILLTNKEWEMSQSAKENYFLCIITNISNNPSLKFIRNPSEILIPKKNIYTTIQINWSITEKQLAEIND